MAKGSVAKSEVYNKIMEIFPGSFMYNSDKELRINTTENGELVQLKLVLTASKTIVENEISSTSSIVEDDCDFPLPWNTVPEEPVKKNLEVTQEEKDELSNLMKVLNL